MKEKILTEEAAPDVLTPVALENNRQGWASKKSPHLPPPSNIYPTSRAKNLGL